MAKTSVRVIIAGRVQGVGYRAWTVATAHGLQLSGWVRNLSDGTVEAVFSGEEGNVISMLSACKLGPTAARVASIAQCPCDETPEGFISKPTV